MAGDAAADESGTPGPPQESTDVPRPSGPLNISLTESLQFRKIGGHELADSWQLLWRESSSF